MENVNDQQVRDECGDYGMPQPGRSYEVMGADGSVYPSEEARLFGIGIRRLHNERTSQDGINLADPATYTDPAA